MPQLNPDNIFVRQNIWIKSAILILGSVTAIVVPVKALYYLTGVTVLYLLLSPVLYKYIAKGVRILLPFFAGYSLLATIFAVPFPTMLVFMVRVLILLFFMVYFSVSLHLHRMMEDNLRLMKIPMVRAIMFFVVATLLFIKSLIEYYKNLEKPVNISHLIPNLINAIVVNWELRDNIEAETSGIILKPYCTPPFLNRSNLLGCVFITYLILVLSI